MKSILNLVIVAVLFFMPDVLYARSNVEFHIQFSLSDAGSSPCRHMTTYATWHSSHPGGNPYERLNEKNRGFLVECRVKIGSAVGTVMGALPTSRDGDALIWGKNVRFFSPEAGELLPELRQVPVLGRLSVGTGAELVGMIYGFDDKVGINRAFKHVPTHLQYHALKRLGNAKEGQITMPLPNLLVSINYRLPVNLGYLTWEQRRLGISKAKLYSIGYSRSY